jgi:hypothetical protein
MANLPPVSTTPAALVAKFAKDVVDTNGDEMTLMLFSGALEKTIHEKNLKQKITSDLLVVCGTVVHTCFHL